MFLPIEKIVILSTTLSNPGKNNNQMHSGLGLVCATQMYHFIEHVEFPKFQAGIFVEWKAPLCLYRNTMLGTVYFTGSEL